jgi:DNA-binding SARP family transcriptional activator
MARSSESSAAIVAKAQAQKVGVTLGPQGETRLQLCGTLALRIQDKRVERLLPGRQGRLLFAYLAVNRRRPLPRKDIIDSLWPTGRPAGVETAFNALLAKVRKVVGNPLVSGKHEIRLALPPDAWVDVEAAAQALHRAQSAVSLGDWASAWGPSRVALHIALRTFMAGHEAPWIDEVRSRLQEVALRAHECVAATGLQLRGPELASAERSARALVQLAPFRESGYLLLMRVLHAQDNVAEALLTYERLRAQLRDQLGVHPGATAQELHRLLLRHPASVS